MNACCSNGQNVEGIHIYNRCSIIKTSYHHSISSNFCIALAGATHKPNDTRKDLQEETYTMLESSPKLERTICCGQVSQESNIYMSFFFRKKRFRYNSCNTETHTHMPRDKILNQATLAFVVSLTSLISSSLYQCPREEKKKF